MHQPISIVLLFFFSFFTLLWLNRARARSALNLPPSPPKFPIIGHIHHLGALPHRSLQALSTKYGPLMLLQLGQTPTLVVKSAEMAKQILKTNDIIFANMPITTASKAFLYGCKDIAFAPYGDYWRQMRKICVLDLLSAKRVQSFRFIREEEIGNMVNKIKKSCSEKKKKNERGASSAGNPVPHRFDAVQEVSGSSHRWRTAAEFDMEGRVSLPPLWQFQSPHNPLSTPLWRLGWFS
ncbi:hypothetical protein ACHQM5_010839 [Ranunculus cassubicifolius]